MKIGMVTLADCAGAEGAVVAVDVLRAFTTAAHAFAAGAREIWLVSTVDEGFALRDGNPGTVLLGEVDGIQVPGFDHGNSPTELAKADLRGRTLIHRTTAGTQGVVRSTRADLLLGTSFVCARATVDYVLERSPPQVTFVVTGADDRRDGDEDRACAEYLAALLRGDEPDVGPYLERVHRSTAGRRFADPGLPQFPPADLEMAVEVDRFTAAMPVHRRDGLLVMTAVRR